MPKKYNNYYSTSAYSLPTADENYEYVSKEEYDRRYLKKANLKIESLVERGRRSQKLAAKDVLIVVSAIGIVATLIGIYLVLHIENYGLQKKITSTQQEIITLKKSNTLTTNEIESEVDYDYVYEYATKVYGMCIPQKQNVITYERPDTEYVRVMGEIPRE